MTIQSTVHTHTFTCQEMNSFLQQIAEHWVITRLSYLHQKNHVLVRAALRGGGARGVIRPPPRIWQIHLYCYNSDDFAPPTFLNRPICPPPDPKSWMQPC